MPFNTNIHSRPILAAMQTVPIKPRPIIDAPQPIYPFITLSREPGSGALTLGKLLAEQLNAIFPGEERWTCWDREIVQKVAADQHLAAHLIEGLEGRRHSFVGDFLSSLSFSDESVHADDDRIYAKVRQSIHALAAAGRVILVGRGGVFVTRDLPGGIHVRLIAPLAHRIESIAASDKLSHRAATAYIKELELKRRDFYRHYWPNESLRPETFTLTMNTAHLEPQTMIAMLVSAVKARMPVITAT